MADPEKCQYCNGYHIGGCHRAPAAPVGVEFEKWWESEGYAATSEPAERQVAEAAFSAGQTFCTAHNDIYKGAYELEKMLVIERERVQVLEERLVKAHRAGQEDARRQIAGMMEDTQEGGVGEFNYAAWIRGLVLTEDSNGG